jgi:lipopolysaccharide transport system ATP-binding protein
MASLLEVGTGFHPELTGRENIYLNGAILGMRRVEIKSKFDEIVDFSGVERYIDTPVKRYSSGMYVRLAFAVAAHLEPEILVVDEVLAVGDADFQKKCLGKLDSVAKDKGRTVLFVSHNMTAIQTLCSSAILLKNGSMASQATPSEIISQYMTAVNLSCQFEFSAPIELEEIKINSISIRKDTATTFENFKESDSLILTVEHSGFSGQKQIDFTFHLKDSLDEAICSFSTANNKSKIEQGAGASNFVFPPYFFQSGQFHLDFFVIEGRSRSIYHRSNLISFNVNEVSREFGQFLGREPGHIRPQIQIRQSKRNR